MSILSDGSFLLDLWTFDNQGERFTVFGRTDTYSAWIKNLKSAAGPVNDPGGCSQNVDVVRGVKYTCAAWVYNQTGGADEKPLHFRISNNDTETDGIAKDEVVSNLCFYPWPSQPYVRNELTGETTNVSWTPDDWTYLTFGEFHCAQNMNVSVRIFTDRRDTNGSDEYVVDDVTMTDTGLAEVASKRRDIRDAVITQLTAAGIPNVSQVEKGPVVQRDIEQFGHISVYYDSENKQYAEMHRREGLLRLNIRVTYQGENADEKCDDIVKDIENNLEGQTNAQFLSLSYIQDLYMETVQPAEEALQTTDAMRFWDCIVLVRYRYDRTVA